jgi:hypothetical protein
MTLSGEQKKLVKKLYEEKADLTFITQGVAGDESLDGRSKLGRAIRGFLIKEGFKFQTKQHQRKEPVVITETQREFIIKQHREHGLSSYSIASLLFSNKKVKKLGMEQRAVSAVLEEECVDEPSESASTYSPVNAASRLVKKINDSTGKELDHEKLSRMEEMAVATLRINLSNSRFCKIMNGFNNMEDRQLFEDEFIRLTWDKPDLTADEVNLYMNMCKAIINLEVISKQIEKLNGIFDGADEDEMTVRLAETIKAKAGEYKDCEKQIQDLTKKLQGDRAIRIAERHSDNASFLSVVQMFQNEEERKNMVLMAEMQNKLVRDEVTRIENMADWKARVLGIKKDDIV